MVMLTKDDLRAIGELLEPINKKLENVTTKQEVKEIVVGNNRILSTLLKVEIAAQAQEIIKAVSAGFQETTNQIKQLGKKLENHESRLSQLEDPEALPRTH